ncbi:MAG TPA: ABC transporter ATP-binding protein [Polyangiaceae bacterium]|nr:ABC transporter ATP-binding protein [Polyangiaceae bacterium]
MTAVVSLRAVTKSYREGETERRVLSRIDASFAAGEFIVLLGKSGSGKSTLLHLVSGIDLPTEGEVHIMGQRLGGLSEEARTLLRRDHLGFIFQAYNLVPTLTVEENVLLPLELRGEAGPTGRDRVHALLERVGLANRAQSFPDLLSGGEQQRVAVARALVHRPALVLADEPTGNLDERTGADILDLLEGLGHEERRTVLVVTHDRDVVARADRVFALEHGVLTEQAEREAREEARR